MSRNYKFHNPEAAYFVSFSVVEWLEVFKNNIYKKILLDSLKYCQKEKNMEIYAWCIMTHHVHLVYRSIGKEKPEQILGDLKKFTSKKIVQAIIENPLEKRRKYYLERFLTAGKSSSNVNKYQFWQHDNNPIEVFSPKVVAEKINYVHYNPVVAGLVFRPEDYEYSSAKDYAGEMGLIENVVVAI